VASGDQQYLTWNIDELLVGEPLPGTLYLFIDYRFITFRAEGDTVDRNAYDRLQLKKVKNLFIRDQDRDKFRGWVDQRAKEEPPPEITAENKNLVSAREDTHRKMLDIFTATHPDKIVSQTMSASKKLVAEVMKFPYAIKPLTQLQTYSRGTVDHSVNVSILSVYLAMQMGYTHALILQHIGVGGLLHDIGKTKVPLDDSDSPAVVETKMQDHPTFGMELMDAQSGVPKEIKMIIAQHHECYDGTGYPKKLRSNAIYDLARIVAIANVFDGLVADGKGTLVERQRNAILQLDQVLYRKFDPQKLDKALKILKLGV
jgi:putative nucleotidyltransferase with HDIG domain